MTDFTPDHYQSAKPPSNGALPWWLGFFLLVIGWLIGFTFSFSNPAIVGAGLAVLVAGFLFVWASLTCPVASLATVLLAQLLLPVYIRVPIPGLPALPPALLLMLAMIGLSFLTAMLNPRRSEISKDEQLLSTAILIYVGVLLFTTILGGTPPAAFPMWVKTALIPACLFFIFLRTVQNTKRVSLILDVLLAAAVTCALFGVHEFITQRNVIANFFAFDVAIEDDFFLWYLVHRNEFQDVPIYRVFSFFTQPLEFSAFMIMSLPYAILCFVERTSFREKFVYGFSTVAIFMGFAVTFSRGPTLAIIVTVLVLSIYQKRIRIWLAAGFFAVCIGLVLAWPLIGEKLLERLQGTKNVSLRFSLWENGISVFLDNPLTGIGYGAYPSHHATTIQDNKIGPMYEFPWQHIERVTTLESIYVTLAAETGILGLSAYFLVLGVYLYLFRRVMRNTSAPRTRTLALASLGGVMAFLFSGMTVANILGYTISILYFGVYVATIAVLSRDLDRSRDPQ